MVVQYFVLFLVNSLNHSNATGDGHYGNQCMRPSLKETTTSRDIIQAFYLKQTSSLSLRVSLLGSFINTKPILSRSIKKRHCSQTKVNLVEESSTGVPQLEPCNEISSTLLFSCTFNTEYPLCWEPVKTWKKCNNRSAFGVFMNSSTG